MSTKTLTKRLALATSVALGAGVLSLVSVTSAHAAASALGIITTNATDGVTYSASASVGYLGKGSGTGLAQTATMLSTGALTITADAPTTSLKTAAIKVIGGTIAQAYGTGISADGTTSGTWVSGLANESDLAVSVKPSSGATSFIVQTYDDVTVGASSGGTLVGQVVITVAAASVSGTPSTAKSAIYYAPVATLGRATALTTDSVAKVGNFYMGNQPWNKVEYAQISLADAYGNAVTNSSGTHLVTATVTGGALVSLNGAAAVAPSPTLVGSAFDTTPNVANGTWVMAVADPSAAPLSTTATISYDGVVIGTKTFNFIGPVAKVVLGTPAIINVTGKTTKDQRGVPVSLYDSAGNAIQVLSTDVAYPTSGFSASSSNPASSSIGINASASDTDSMYWADWSCAAIIAAHKDSVSMKYTNPTDGSVITSNAVSVSCAGGADTYTAKYDKATYNSGDVAVLTVQFLDSKGNLAADNSGTSSITKSTPFSGYLTTAPQISVAGGTLAAAVTTADATALGALTYRVLVGSTSGTFQTVVSATAINTGADGVAQTVALNIGSSGTSLNDVLKGIVSLIASINKQIAALAKLVTKK
jgi:hypothetical protein